MAYAIPNAYIDCAPGCARSNRPTLRLKPTCLPDRMNKPTIVIAIPVAAPAHGTARTMLPSP